MLCADLHLHTCFSDGTYTPEELVRHARRQELSAVALTDHDTVEGCERMADACRSSGLEFVSGVELTVESEEIEIHLLGYFIDVHHPGLLQAMTSFQQARQNRIREMVERLNRLQIPLQAEAVLQLANCRAPGRPHLARALVQAGICASHEEAFERFLKKKRPAWVPKFHLSAREAVRLLHEAGGLAVWAHPGLNRRDALIDGLIAAGLDGIECFHSRHSAAQTEHYQALAAERGLLVTGGSDCHGLNKGQPLIGTVRLPYEFVERLKARL